MTNDKVFAMKLSQIYPLLVAKAERKGRTRAEVDTVTCWLTGYDAEGLAAQLEKDVDYGTFSAKRRHQTQKLRLSPERSAAFASKRSTIP